MADFASLAWLHTIIGREGEIISWWQMSARAVLVFVVGVALVRVADKRAFGKWGAFDIIFSVIIGSSLSRALTGSAPFIPTLCACIALVMLHTLLARAAVRIDAVGPLAKGRPTQLVCDGVCDERAMRKHGIGTGDLMAALRCAGLDDLKKVRAMFLERNGAISVIRADRSDGDG